MQKAEKVWESKQKFAKNMLKKLREYEKVRKSMLNSKYDKSWESMNRYEGVKKPLLVQPLQLQYISLG